MKAPLETGQNQTWHFEVQTSKDGSVVELAWPGIADRIPQGHDLKLTDLGDGSAEYGMLDVGSMSFVSGSEPRHFMITAVKTSEEAQASTPQGINLWQNYPNPFNPLTEIKYKIPARSLVRLHIYNVAGRLVRVVKDEIQEAGTYSVYWDGLDSGGNRVSSGIYFCRLTSGDCGMTRKMVLMK